MTDERIRNYLRSRGQATPPVDLESSIAHALDGIPQRPAWVALLVPVAVATGLAGVVAALALIVGTEPPVGPATPTTTPVPSSPTASASPVPLSTPDAAMDARRVDQEGETAVIEAIDSLGAWGEITLTREPDVGGYADDTVDPGSFIVQLSVRYVAQRLPDPEEFGRPDWRLTTADGSTAGGHVDHLSIGTYPGAIDIFTTPVNGTLMFEVARADAGQELFLAYQPPGHERPLHRFLVRSPGEPPPVVPPPTPAATPEPLSYLERDGIGFSIIDSAEADALFEAPDTCTNPEAGYTVSFPDAWYTNTAIGDTPACSWFSPDFFEADEQGSVPEEIAIVLSSFDGGIGFVHQPVYSVSDELRIAGFTAVRTEELGGFGAEGELPASLHTYQYVIYASEEAYDVGLKIIGTTSNEHAGDYALNKAVLDRIMASLRLSD